MIITINKLKSIPANTIKSIELIAAPSSKYEAKGIGGLINIITNTKRGLTGIQGYAGLGVDQFGSVYVNAYLTSRLDKFAISTRGNASQFKLPTSYTSSESPPSIHKAYASPPTKISG